tara:strand:+ start:118 stop:420 length:303 start_codon:yes stop_codon:yes gene_type:complete
MKNTERKNKMVDEITQAAKDGNILKALDGLKVQAIGCAMLEKIKDGKKYRLATFQSKIYGKCVAFYPLRGKNHIISHSAFSVLESIQGRSNGHLNGLEII